MVDSIHGCFTGDCPHLMQEDCMRALRTYCGALESQIEHVEDRLKKLKNRLIDMHKYNCTKDNCMLDGGNEHVLHFELEDGIECTECGDDGEEPNPYCDACGDPDAGVDAAKEGG